MDAEFADEGNGSSPGPPPHQNGGAPNQCVQRSRKRIVQAT